MSWIRPNLSGTKTVLIIDKADKNRNIHGHIKLGVSGTDTLMDTLKAIRPGNSSGHGQDFKMQKSSWTHYTSLQPAVHGPTTHGHIQDFEARELHGNVPAWTKPKLSGTETVLIRYSSFRRGHGTGHIQKP